MKKGQTKSRYTATLKAVFSGDCFFTNHSHILALDNSLAFPLNLVEMICYKSSTILTLQCTENVLYCTVYCTVYCKVKIFDCVNLHFVNLKSVYPSKDFTSTRSPAKFALCLFWIRGVMHTAETPQCDAYRGVLTKFSFLDSAVSWVWLCFVMPTTKSDSAISCSERIFLLFILIKPVTICKFGE